MVKAKLYTVDNSSMVNTFFIKAGNETQLYKNICNESFKTKSSGLVAYILGEFSVRYEVLGNLSSGDMENILNYMSDEEV